MSHDSSTILEKEWESPLSAAVSLRDRDIIGNVRRALERHEVLLAYQPVVFSAAHDRPAFYEGLVRILDETGRIIPAAEFMGAVETHEAGRLIDCAALELGLTALAKQPALRLSINMSARSIGFPRWTEVLDRGLAKDPTIAERLILEITESSAMVMPELVTVFMANLTRRGVTFALDDFGAGYTAFRYFKDFYFDILKIDGQFVRGIDADPNNQVLANALVSIGRHFDMLTIAESVETPAEAAFLAESGFDCMQGYIFGAPTAMPPWKTSEARRA